jgi:dTDP-4-amino-4,6-dideoxygalactose transaminase
VEETGTIGDIGCYSFNGNKIITTGSGGMIVSANAERAARLKHLTTQAKASTTDYSHDEIGYNYRLSNLSAALGIAQLENLSTFLKAKIEIARRYENLLAGTGVMPAPHAPWASPSFWLYSTLLGAGHPYPGEVVARLGALGIEARRTWKPLHLQAPYRRTAVLGGQVAEHLHRYGVSLPTSVSLTDSQQETVVRQLLSVCRDN